ncbi:MAG: DUF1080 domain-containing protein [Bacteroidetes bacterium]|nr:MAG: DUF1080 domain-containing protein [Bacteroidota bacterium]
MKTFSLASLLCLLACLAFGQNQHQGQYVSIFDGQTLNGWTPTKENASSFFVKDGALVCRGGRAHIFYTGENGQADYKNFELSLKVRTMPGSNSGVYFHTQYQEKGWPTVGFEAQVNSTHSDPRKTGSLYGIVNIWAPPEVKERFVVRVDQKQEVFVLKPQAPSTDGEWFDYYIRVQDNTITIKVNGETTVEWTQPEGWAKARRIGHGTIGLQGHDPKSEVHYKDIKIRALD